MPSAPVAAETASPRKGACAYCRQPLEGYAAAHVCPACRQPQPLARGEDFFSAFGLSRRFGIDRAELQKRFYEISRALHPDRFTGAGPEARARSLERMSFLNEAYRALKDPAELRDYFLELEGFERPEGSAEGAQAKIPIELAESWFELQDALAEDPAGAPARLADFERGLRGLKEGAAGALAELERSIDAAADSGQPVPRALLQRLYDGIRASGYLSSMERDVGRIRARMPG